MRTELLRERHLGKPDLLRLVELARAVLEREPNVLQLADPLTVVGDLHGQLYDMEQLFAAGGDPLARRYLFLGDFVDRGAWGLEVLVVVLMLKVLGPERTFLLRGNHETRQLTSNYGFKPEVVSKYDQQVYDEIMLLFDALPLAAVVSQKFFCAHAGISPKIVKLADMNKDNRKVEIQDNCWQNDLIWADPVDSESGEQKHLFIVNKKRGTSVIFGSAALDIFLKKNGLKTLLRGHEVFYEGYKAFNWKGHNEWQVCTVFSAPNYTDTYKNLGAVLAIDVA